MELFDLNIDQPSRRGPRLPIGKGLMTLPRQHGAEQGPSRSLADVDRPIAGEQSLVTTKVWRLLPACWIRVYVTGIC